MKGISGSELFAKSIVSQGIGYVFTVSTDRLKPIIDALEAQKDVKVIKARNETAATAMADGYIRRSKKYAAILTDDNGRSISQISGITNAWADKIPLISFSLCSDEEPDFNKGYDRYRFDQNAVFHPVTIWRKRVRSVEDIPGAIEEGINKSSKHRMGPVHIDIPVGLLSQKVPIDAAYVPKTESFTERVITPIRLAGDEDAVDKAVSLIKNAQKPLIFCGGGIKTSEAEEDVLRFMEEFKIPAATSMAGVGTIPSDHKYCLGGPSYTAGEVFHVAIKEADVVIAIGIGFSGLEGFGLPPLWSDKIKFIHIDIDPLQIGLNVYPEVSILGDAKTVLAQLSDKMHADGFKAKPGWTRWRGRLGKLKKARRRRLDEIANRPWPTLHQGTVAQKLGELVKKHDPLVVMDGGNTPLFAAMYAPSVKSREVFFPFGMSALGGGIPYTIGVQLASPDRPVALLTGDGSFMYNVQELETIRRLNLSILIIVNNDSAWNMIKAMQTMMFERRYLGTELPDVDYARIARGFGLYSERITKAEDMIPACERVIERGGPALLDCITDDRNLPDSLISFSLVEFKGVQINSKKLLKSLLMMRDIGFVRMRHQMTYIMKIVRALLIRGREK